MVVAQIGLEPGHFFRWGQGVQWKSPISSAPGPGRKVALKLAQESRELWQAGRHDEAMTKLEQAATKDPTNPEICLGLGKAWGTRYEWKRAEGWFQKAFQLAGDSVAVRFDAATHYYQLGRVEGAVECLQHVLRLQPGRADALILLGEIQERRHELDQAEQFLRKAKALAPMHLGVQFLEARLARRRKDWVRAEALDRALAHDTRIPPDLRYRAGMEWGQVLDAQGRYEEAMRAFEEAKAIQLPHVQPFWGILAQVRERAREMLELADSEMFKRWRMALSDLGEERRVALLCGHPRSGTTLLEQVLDHHPDVVTAEETRILHDEVYLPLSQGQSVDTPLSQVLDQLGVRSLRGARQRYGALMEQFLGRDLGGRLLVDKNPAFSILLLPVARILPEARIMVMLRDPRDVVISCFMQPLALNPVSSSYVSLATTVEQYVETMEFLIQMRPRLAQATHDVRYEHLVTDPRGCAGEALRFLGVEWNDSILQHDSAQKGKWVRSPTYADVAQPIHQRALGRWKNYQRWLEPYLERLQPVMGQLGYPD